MRRSRAPTIEMLRHHYGADVANGMQPEYVKRGRYLTGSCKAKLKEIDLY